MRLQWVAVLTAMLLAAPLAAQTVPCPDRLAAIRVSEIKPGKAALAAQAIADHKAWYAKRRLPTTVERVPVLKLGPDGGMTTDATRFMTITRYRGATRPTEDAEWTAFTKKYADSTTIASTTRVCLN